MAASWPTTSTLHPMPVSVGARRANESFPHYEAGEKSSQPSRNRGAFIHEWGVPAGLDEKVWAMTSCFAGCGGKLCHP